MRVIDFEYDGFKLSDFGCMIAHIVNETKDSVSLNNNIEVSGVKSPTSEVYTQTGSKYNDVISLPQFDIIKASCVDGQADVKMEEEEYLGIVRWLCQKRYRELRLIYDDYSFSGVYYTGYFNCSPIVCGGQIIGATVDFKSNAPYAFCDSILINKAFSSSDNTLTVVDPSDEYGVNYCDKMTIKCLEDCNLSIKNKADTTNTISINNCKSGETITIYGKTKMIETDNVVHSAKIASDFNYSYPRFVNDVNLENVFTCSNKCEVTITYTPLRKIGGIIC